MPGVTERCCNADCALEDQDGPCWGVVSAVAEETCGDDWWWIHCCEGHADMFSMYGKYNPEPEDET